MKGFYCFSNVFHQLWPMVSVLASRSEGVVTLVDVCIGIVDMHDVTMLAEQATCVVTM